MILANGSISNQVLIWRVRDEGSTMLPTYLATFEVSPAVRDMLEADRDRGHVHIMSAFRPHLGDRPRAAAGVLWHLDGSHRVLTVRATEPPLRPAILGASTEPVPVPRVSVGSIGIIDISLSCLKTPPSNVAVELRAELQQGKCYRSKPVVVPEGERDTWARRRLAAVGLEVAAGTLKLGPIRYASLGGKRRGIPYVDLHAQDVVTDADAFTKAFANGLGKGRSYGLGMIRLRSVPDT